MFYETQELTQREATRFGILFDKKIGTERETTCHGEKRSILCMELEPEEVKLCKKIDETVADQFFEIPESWEYPHP